MSFGTRLRYLRQNSALRQEDIGRMLNVSKSAVSQWENDIRVPEISIITKLARYFNTSIDYLFEKSDSIHHICPGTSIGIPILGTTWVDISHLTDEYIHGYLDVPDTLRADYVLQVEGDTMIGAGILDGDYAICRDTQIATSGQLAVAIKDMGNGFSEATLKYYFDNGKHAVLRSTNPKYSEVLMSDGYRIAGVMVALARPNVPKYQVYRDYLTIAGHKEWTELIELANSAGIKPEHLKAYVDMSIEMGKKNK